MIDLRLHFNETRMVSQLYFGTTTDGPSFGGGKKIFSSLKQFFPDFGSAEAKISVLTSIEM
jgi:hypothetical protein